MGRYQRNTDRCTTTHRGPYSDREEEGVGRRSVVEEEGIAGRSLVVEGVALGHRGRRSVMKDSHWI
jgi:hypothetical protein